MIAAQVFIDNKNSTYTRHKSRNKTESPVNIIICWKHSWLLFDPLSLIAPAITSWLLAPQMASVCTSHHQLTVGTTDGLCLHQPSPADCWHHRWPLSAQAITSWLLAPQMASVCTSHHQLTVGTTDGLCTSHHQLTVGTTDGLCLHQPSPADCWHHRWPLSAPAITSWLLAPQMASVCTSHH